MSIKITKENRFKKVRVRKRKGDRITYVPLHVTEQAWFKKDWVIEDPSIEQAELREAAGNPSKLRQVAKAQGIDVDGKTEEEIIDEMSTRAEPEKPKDPEEEKTEEKPKEKKSKLAASIDKAKKSLSRKKKK